MKIVLQLQNLSYLCLAHISHITLVHPSKYPSLSGLCQFLLLSFLFLLLRDYNNMLTANTFRWTITKTLQCGGRAVWCSKILFVCLFGWLNLSLNPDSVICSQMPLGKCICDDYLNSLNYWRIRLIKTIVLA